ncbi:claudin-5b [Gadus macrocephalus]|uniref:claudin-5b n=1 Tax=Gadus macrocephalus TaxID=80720 RepID=UPI0028CB2C05|nr:claudin-5b [Gadus macrocephalus]
MFSVCLEFLGMGSSILGSLLVMIACGLPTWKVSAFIEANIVVAQTMWDGLWMSCVFQSTGQMQCKLHESMLALNPDMQTARALTVISAVLSIVALMVTIAGARYTNCIGDETVKARVVGTGGVLYILSGLIVFIPLCWMANSIIVDFYSTQVPPSKKREIGSAIYIGWAAAALLLLGGTLLCCSSGTRGLRSDYPIKYVATKTASSDKGKKHFV